jgi:hypothetical protein
MAANLGRTDRIIRLILGFLVICLGLYLQTPVGVIGAIPILTALIGWCPGYVPFGFSTCRDEQQP